MIKWVYLQAKSWAKPRSFKKIIGVVFLVVVSILFLVFTDLPKQGQLEIYFFDVGQGDATLIKTKSGKQILVDVGPDKSLVRSLGRVMPFWDRQIEVVILTHLHSDHIGGIIELMKSYQIGTLFVNNTGYVSPWVSELKSTIEIKEINSQALLRGDKIKLDGLTIKSLWPEQNSLAYLEDENRKAVVLLLSYQGFRILLPSDFEFTQRTGQDLIVNVGEVNVLKVPHQGSSASLSEIDIIRLNPEVVVISVGRNNYGHPDEEIIKLLENRVPLFYRTDYDGTIKINASNSNDYTVMSE